MNLTALASEFVTQRGASGGLYVSEPQVLQSLIDATRFYAGWQALADVASATLADVTGATALEAGEWAIIAPLFRLYVERETALVLEASRSLGVDGIGRDSASVAGDIQNAEAQMPQQAFAEDVFSIGLEATTV